MSSMQLMIEAHISCALFITDESHRVQCCAVVSPAEFFRVLLSGRVYLVLGITLQTVYIFSPWSDNRESVTTI
jgi:hypothetical protein